MIDLETMGQGPRSAITQIGAAYFDIETGIVGAELLVNVDLESSMANGLEVDGPTIKFWLEQSHRDFLSGRVWDISDALIAFTMFIQPKTNVWSHATFDVPILLNAYKALRIAEPFHYRDARDLRTVFHLAGAVPVDDVPFRAHNALEDCRHQIRQLVTAYNALKPKEATCPTSVGETNGAK
jgi:hypothetical protein